MELRLEDIQTIVMTLVYDGRVDEVEPDDEADDQDHYRWALSSREALIVSGCNKHICPILERPCARSARD